MTGPDVLEHPAGAIAPEIEQEPSSSSRGALLIVPEPVSYSPVWELQLRLHEERVRAMRPDTLLLVEHQPVYTLGRSAHASHWGGDEQPLREHGVKLHHVNRGGSVTYHGPGQIVAYPIFQLARYATGPKQFVRLLEDVILRVLRTRNIGGYRIAKKPGVWVSIPDEQKIASIGIRVEHGVTLHGFALNVDMDLTPFERIVPCGLADCRVTSMADVLKRSVPIDTLKYEIAQAFAQVFAIKWSNPAEQYRLSLTTDG